MSDKVGWGWLYVVETAKKAYKFVVVSCYQKSLNTLQKLRKLKHIKKTVQIATHIVSFASLCFIISYSFFTRERTFILVIPSGSVYNI